MPRKPVIACYLILDRGALELGVPEGWVVQPRRGDAGAIAVNDA